MPREWLPNTQLDDGPDDVVRPVGAAYPAGPEQWAMHVEDGEEDGEID